MHIFFFNSKHLGNLDLASKEIFNSLGLESIFLGDSMNCLSNIYYTTSVFGFSIKIELNSYDYEDEYEYMITVRKDVLSTANCDDSCFPFFIQLVKRLLLNNEIIIAEEIGNSLHVIQEN